jgi:signal transduction histidine kinase
VSWPAFSVRAPAFAEFKDATQPAIFVFIAYLVGAELAFLIGTLSDKIFAPFWPPNVVLLGAMLLMPRERWWLAIAAAFPAHALAEAGVGMPVAQMLVAFVSNVAVAGASAAGIWWLLGEPPWFATVRKATIYVVLVGFVCPAIAAFGGAFVQILGGAREGYPTLWLHWLAANVLGNLTLGPIALIVAGEGMKAFWPRTRARQIEAVLLIFALVIVANVAFRASAGSVTEAFLPSVLYAPLPLIVWCAARFGAAGASAGILTVTIALIGCALNGPGLFVAGTPEANVFALQVFVVCLAVPVLLLGASIDQTRQVEGELKQDEDRIALVAADANLGFWHRDSATRRFWISADCRRLFGLSESGELTPQRILAAVHPDDIGLASDALLPGEQSGSGSAVEFRVVLPGGQTRWILSRSRSKPRESGSHSFETSGIFVDVTARKTAEVEAEQQRRELAHLMRVSQVGELSSGLAHEITQPLTAILANAQAARLMLESSPADLSVIAEVLDDIIREDHRAGEVIRRLRSLLKDSETSSEEVNLNDLVNSTLQLLHNELISRRIKVDRDLDPGVPSVFGDAVQLQQVILNLVMNAAEAVHQMTKARRSILLRTRHCNDNTVEIVVIDHGVGISPGDQMKIFEPFFTTKERGLGLGLSICSTIIGRHSGTLTLENNPDEGATASMRVPVERRSGGRS